MTPRKSEGEGLVPRDIFASEDWWQKLDTAKRDAVAEEANALGNAMMSYGFSALAIGEHLTRARELLKDHYGAFTAFASKFRFTRQTAYNYINGYAEAKSRYPELILRAAMARGITITSPGYANAVKRLPPPKVLTVEKANEYLDKLIVVKNKERAEPNEGDDDPETMLRECFRFVDIRFRRLPKNHKTRMGWTRSLVGMLLNNLGVSNEQSFGPTAIPDTFRAARGRPKKHTA